MSRILLKSLAQQRVMDASITTGQDCAGVRGGRLLSWQERLAGLRDLGLWEHALSLGLNIFVTAQSRDAKVCQSLGLDTTECCCTLWSESIKVGGSLGLDSTTMWQSQYKSSKVIFCLSLVSTPVCCSCGLRAAKTTSVLV